MKKTLLLGLFLLIGLMVQAQNEITIDGKVANVKDGLVITVVRYDGRVGNTIATDTIKSGRFYFEVKPEKEFDNLSLFVLSNDFPSMFREVYATPNTHIQVNGKDNLICTWEVKSNVKEQKEFDRYLYAAKDLWIEYQRIMVKIGGCWEIVDSSTATSEEKQVAKDEIKKLHEQTGKIQLEIKKVEIGLMKDSPVTTIWMDKLYELSMSVRYGTNYPYTEEVKTLYARMSEEQKQSSLGQLITANVFPPKVVKIGEDMADGDLYDLEGNLHHLSELKGKYLLLDFWSSGCGPCIMAIPEMGELQQKYADKLTVVSLSSDTEKRWKAASARHKMTWKNWSDKKQESGLYAQYGVRGIPHYVLISPEGKMEDTWSGYGKGSLLRKLRPFMNPKPAMSVEKKEGVLRVNYPDYQADKTGGILEIKQVECTSNSTVLHFKAYYTPNYWIKLSETSSLSTPDGKQYKVLKSEGITLGKEFFMPESGEAEFSLTFEPLPKETKTFDFQEGEGQNVWAIRGIKIVK
ncbi:MAG: AhpC/TSA family protein [Bacteroidaceae bacterium]|nr:AhpC/TSA family protein [Bacteroidaceae bacterium]